MGPALDELTQPGFVHDVCSAVHPMALFAQARSLLAEHGLEWIQPPIPLAHPFDDGSAAICIDPWKRRPLGWGWMAQRTRAW